MLEIKNLTVSYGAINALQGVSLSVPAGGIVTLIGSNGAGKTTTLKTVSGLLQPGSGEILYDGKTSPACRRTKSWRAACRTFPKAG